MVNRCQSRRPIHLNKRCRLHLRRTNKSYRIDETYSALSSVLLRRVKVPLVLG